MMISKPFILISIVLALSACSSAKLEARLEANPQCKDVVNPKTGALMPCPGSDKAFYASVGLAPSKPVAMNNAAATTTTTQSTEASSSPAPAVSKAVSNSSGNSASLSTAPVDCKPQIHKKTGGTLPCPAAD